ncbi:hypothetical protein Bbelb_081060 [Branchiostoma belcheri]|nr:hypothetical protein Bbelb_081060 [Branchiostoma belcheri]
MQVTVPVGEPNYKNRNFSKGHLAPFLQSAYAGNTTTSLGCDLPVKMDPLIASYYRRASIPDNLVRKKRGSNPDLPPIEQATESTRAWLAGKRMPGHTGRTLLERSFNAKFWSRSDTSIPTPNQSSLPTWIAASTPDTVPATPCPLVKRLQPLQRSLCNVCATFNRRPGNAGEAAVLKTFGAVGGPLQKRQRWPGVHGIALTGANFCLAVVSGFERNAPAKFRQCDRALRPGPVTLAGLCWSVPFTVGTGSEFRQRSSPLRHLYTNAKPECIADMDRCFNARHRSSNLVSARKTFATAPATFVQRLITARATLAKQR